MISLDGSNNRNRLELLVPRNTLTAEGASGQ
jgi:hypothetical protein